MTGSPPCWCGNEEFFPFSPEYVRCARCGTLVRTQRREVEIARVVDDEADFYGREYWFSHQEHCLGCPNIVSRARADLPERCLYWLRTLLKYKLPPSRVLEVGSGPGAFVAMLRWAGFDATGLELSPWVVQFIRETFQVPVLRGPIEEQEVEPGSLDVIALMDVLEHLHRPLSTISHCLRLLKPDGILLIQTPCYPDGRSHGDMLAQQDRFLEMLRPPDHLYLFGRQSIHDLLGSAGADHVVFEPALFSQYDMFVVASRVCSVTHGPEQIATALSAQPGGRMIQALLDLDDARSELDRRYGDSEADRAARLAVIEEQGRRLGEVDGERNSLRAQVDALRRQAELAEKDLAARLGGAEGERNSLRAQVDGLHRRVEVIEADRAARLAVIQEQGWRLGVVEGERNALKAEVEEKERHLRNLHALLRAIERTRTYMVLRLLGRWSWIEEAIAQASADRPAAPGVTAAAEETRFDALYAGIREPRKKEWISYAPGAEDRITDRLRAFGFDVRFYDVDVADYHRYFAAARYLEAFPDYYPSHRAEKSLEHYLAAKLLELGGQDVYIDIASQHSPAPDIYRTLFGATTYRQDLAYPSGLDEDRIGGDAARLPVPDGFATKMALHCSFEHFEGESDIGFIQEARRVLRPGGAACFVPLYLLEEYAIQTDPEVAVPAGVEFEKDAVVYGARGWGNRHGRFYDPEHLAARILANAGGLTVEIYRIVNAAQIDHSCYVRFAMVIRKPPAEGLRDDESMAEV